MNCFKILWPWVKNFQYISHASFRVNLLLLASNINLQSFELNFSLLYVICSCLLLECCSSTIIFITKSFSLILLTSYSSSNCLYTSFSVLLLATSLMSEEDDRSSFWTFYSSFMSSSSESKLFVNLSLLFEFRRYTFVYLFISLCWIINILTHKSNYI